MGPVLGRLEGGREEDVSAVELEGPSPPPRVEVAPLTSEEKENREKERSIIKSVFQEVKTGRGRTNQSGYRHSPPNSDVPWDPSFFLDDFRNT